MQREHKHVLLGVQAQQLAPQHQVLGQDKWALRFIVVEPLGRWLPLAGAGGGDDAV